MKRQPQPYPPCAPSRLPAGPCDCPEAALVQQTGILMADCDDCPRYGQGGGHSAAPDAARLGPVDHRDPAPSPQPLHSRRCAMINRPLRAFAWVRDLGDPDFSIGIDPRAHLTVLESGTRMVNLRLGRIPFATERTRRGATLRLWVRRDGCEEQAQALEAGAKLLREVSR